MGWPQSQDYNEAIQNAKTCFKDPELSKGAAVTNPLGMPLPCSGNFADVYQVHCPETKTRWAVKCFTRGDPKALEDRYAKIDQHLQQAKLPFAVGFRYLVEGIRVRGQWHPVLKMQWVEGFTLNHFVRDNLDKPNVLDALLQIWVRMGKRLREADMAHADLQHGNVLLVPGSTPASLAVKLIDYDGMWVPALEGKKSGEVGHPAYQHTKRLYESTYSKEVDRFPLLVVATALRCLRVAGRPLWEKFDNGDNLLFREADMAAPEKSPLFAELSKIQDSQALKLIEAIRASCDLPLEQCPHLDELYSGLQPSGKPATAALPQPGAVFAEFGNPDSPTERTSRRPARKEAMSPDVKKWAVIGGGAGTALLALIVVIALASGGKDKGVPVAPVQGDKRKDGGVPDPKPPTQLTLGPLANLRLSPGESQQLIAHVKGGNGAAFRAELTELPEGVKAEQINSDARSGRVVWRLKAAADAPSGERQVKLVATAGEARTQGSFRLSVEKKVVVQAFPLRFEGREDNVELENTRDMLDLNGTFTVEAWVRWDGKPSHRLWALMGDEIWPGMTPGKLPVPRICGWILRIHEEAGKHKLDFTIAADSAGKEEWFSVVSPPQEPSEDWQHVAVCKQRDEIRLYWNGALVGIKPTEERSFDKAATNLYLGVRKWGYRERDFKGAFRAVRLSSTPRYGQGFLPAQHLEKDKDTILLLDFSKNDPKTIPDVTGNNRHGLIEGAKWGSPIQLP